MEIEEIKKRIALTEKQKKALDELVEAFNKVSESGIEIVLDTASCSVAVLNVLNMEYLTPNEGESDAVPIDNCCEWHPIDDLPITNYNSVFSKLNAIFYDK